MQEEKNDIVQVVEVTAMEAQVRGEIDMQIATAKKYPRNVTKALAKIKSLATKDTKTAQECWYALPRAGKVIEGPGIRAAEIVGSSWGNLRIQNRVTDIGQTMVTCQSSCIDLETNYGVSTEVKRSIVTKNGQRYSNDMIVTTANAGCSIAMRNTMFKIVPKALIQDTLDEIKKVGMGKDRTLAEHIKAIYAYFKKHDVTQAQILTLLGIEGEVEITLEHVGHLRGLATAIEEGTTTIAECFKKEDAALDKIKNKLNGGKKEDEKTGAESKETEKKTSGKARTGSKKTSGKKEEPPKEEEPEEETPPEPDTEVVDEEEPLL